MALLEVQGLTAGYGIVQVLFGLDFSVDAGEAVVILGANGSGKTTTLRAVSGIVAAGVSHVPQGRGTISDLTVDENLRAGAYSRRDRGIAADIEHWYSVFPRLGERRDQAAGSMSGGEQQMLAIARAFMSRPRLVLLDEPSLGLAPLVTREVFDRVGDLVRDTGTAVLVVEQNANLALAFASRAYVLEAGRIVNQGSSDELRGDESIRQAYLGS